MRLSWPIVLAVILGLVAPAVQLGKRNKGAPWINKRILIGRTKPTPPRHKIPTFTTVARLQSQVGVNPAAGEIKYHNKLDGGLFKILSVASNDLLTRN